MDSGDPYGIPADNPFAQGGGRPEIWAYGLRNPWRFSFDRQTGDLYIGDVGQGTLEEVDHEPAGSTGGVNYGWDIMEGEECFNAASCDTEGLTLPVFVYPTHTGGTCAVTGGYIYRGSSLPGSKACICLEITAPARYGVSSELLTAIGSRPHCSRRGSGSLPLESDEAGEIYLVGYSGNVYRLSTP